MSKGTSATVVLAARLGRDPEVSFKGEGNAMCRFTACVTTGFGEREAQTWYDVTAWGKTAEFVGQYAKTGAKVAVTGELSMRAYTKKDGTTGHSLDVKAYSVDLLDSKTEGTAQERPTTPAKRQGYDSPENRATDEPLPW
jgi:single-strand DNA-binding protein